MARKQKGGEDDEAPKPGIDIEKAINWARANGCSVRKLKNNDRSCSHPRMPVPCNFSDHRDSSPRHLSCWLRELKRVLDTPASAVGREPPARRSWGDGGGQNPQSPSGVTRPKGPPKKPTKAQQQAEKKADPKKPAAKKKPKK